MFYYAYFNRKNPMLKILNPYNQSLVCQRDYANEQEIEAAVSSLADTFQTWRDTSFTKRHEFVAKGIEYFEQNKQQIAMDISQQMGKPLTQANNELNTFIARAQYLLDNAAESLKSYELPEENNLTRKIIHEPLGIVFNIAAWNYPLLIPVNVIVPALLAGNVVLLKHSAKTPLCGEVFAKAFKDVVKHIIINHEQTEQVVNDQRVQYVAFTGSVGGGYAVNQYAANRLIDVGLELGGKDAAYVADDADLDSAVENLVDGACYNAGQSCCGIERVYVHESHYEAFVEKAKVLMSQYKLGDPQELETTMGPLANPNAMDFLEKQVKEAEENGAQLILGGKRISIGEGQFFPPTLLKDVPQNISLMQDESFAPILPVHKVKSDEEALLKMQDSTLGLTASIWTKSDKRANWFAKQLDVGTVFQNRCDYLDPGLAWVGRKDSGKGVTLSSYGFLQLTRRKSLHLKKYTQSG